MLNYLVSGLQKLGWSLRLKIGLAFGLILFCFIINGLISILLLLNIETNQQRERTAAIALERLHQYELAYQGGLDVYFDDIFYNNSTYIRDSFSSTIVGSLLQHDQNDPDPATREFAARFLELYNPVLSHFSDLKIASRQGDFEQAKAQWQRFNPDFKKITALLADRGPQLEASRASEEQNLNNIIFLSIATIIGIAVLSVALALFLLLLIERVLMQPLNRLQRGLNALAQGELSQQFEIANRDEVGQLAKSFQQALLSLQQVLKGVQIGESLRTVTGQLTNVSKQQSQGSNEQITALAQVIAAMQALSRTAGQIADRAVQVANLTDNTLEQIERVSRASCTSQERVLQMGRVIEDTLNGIDRVGRQVEQFRQQMDDLNEQSASISKVVNLLGSIADEVHLLALNAAIEAAGAGEYGERFRAVAHQIKQLATRSNQATQEARELINQVQLSSQLTLNQVAQGQAEVVTVIEINSGLRLSLEELEQSAQEVSGAVAHLVELSGQVNHQAEEIKEATHEQRISSQQVVVSARSAEEVAEQTSGATHQIAASSIQLESLTNQLSEVLKQVKLAA